MDENIAYTKTNLISAKGTLDLSLKGFDLLDKKRNVLIMSMMGFIDKAEAVQNKVTVIFEEAYEALQTANITMGITNVEQISQSVPEFEDFHILDKSIMGVEIPEILHKEQSLERYYSFYNTNTALDVAFKKFQEVKELLFELSEIEDSVYKLAMEVKRTQKRANALQNIQIPKYKGIVKAITDVLEEKEREDFFRLKVVKKKHGE
ncbi:MAG: V-type synthase subunit [Clostridia bacterium]|jgi:V/A-type H+-transporting ATPase subunit D|nr:V-type synthase subunit [Clostridia bacterium]